MNSKTPKLIKKKKKKTADCATYAQSAEEVSCLICFHKIDSIDRGMRPTETGPSA